MKNLIKVLLIIAVSIVALNAAKITETQCVKKGKNFIFASGECLQFYVALTDNTNSLNIIIPGTWKAGTNILARYAPFAEDLALQTDISTISIALPGYSGSSTNNFLALSHNSKTNPQAASKRYLLFLANVINAFKQKYHAKKINYIGHSAGAMMGATLAGLKPNLISNLFCAGGIYDIHKKNKTKGLVSAIDYINSISKTTKIVLIYGTKDTISKPKLTKDFYKLAKSKGLDVSIVKVKGSKHLGLDMSDKSIEAISETLSN
ncbi:MAG: alpha/beta hydrolase [Epsilonproteobacteria bacterium]|nr:alpha/beta hydrolase [Campylobacterota bacterium]